MRLVLVTLLLAAGTCAQSPKIPADEMTMAARAYTPVFTFSAESNVVEVPVVVRDSNDRAQSNLRREQFQLFMDGKPVAITSFTALHGGATETAAAPTDGTAPAVPVREAAAKAVPHSVIWFFDDYEGNLFDLGSARQAALKLIQAGLYPGERLGVYTMSGDVAVDLTDDPAKLAAAIAKITPHDQTLGFNSCPTLTSSQAYEYSEGREEGDFEVGVGAKAGCIRDGSAGHFVARQELHTQADQAWIYYQDVAQAVLDDLNHMVNRLARQPGDRTIVLASSGFISRTLQTEQAMLVQHALSQRVVINAMDTKGLVYKYPPGYAVLPNGVMGEMMGANASMADVAADTGGRFLHNNNGLINAFREYSATPEASYVLAFTPTGIPEDGALHHLKVKVTAHGDLTVQARSGFVAPAAPRTRTALLLLQDEMRSAVMGSDNPTGVPAVVRAAPGAGKVEVAFALDPRGFGFTKANGRDTNAITVVAAVLDTEGKFVAGSTGTLRLNLKSATLQAISKPGAGISAGIEVAAPAGTYRLRVVVEESGKGALSAFTETVTVR